jgi:hypothetical protein
MPAPDDISGEIRKHLPEALAILQRDPNISDLLLSQIMMSKMVFAKKVDPKVCKWCAEVVIANFDICGSTFDSYLEELPKLLKRFGSPQLVVDVLADKSSESHRLYHEAFVLGLLEKINTAQK